MSPEYFGQLLIVGTSMGRKKRNPIGVYDDGILCISCDNKIGVYDEYAAQFLNGVQLETHPSGAGWLATGINQPLLKLFCISYLWRASITSRKEFVGVSLGAKHERAIKELILNNSHGSINQYSVVFAKFNGSNDTVGGLLFPAKTRIGNILYYEAYLPKLYKFWVKVDSREDQDMTNFSLGAQNEMIIFDKGDFESSREKSIMVRAVMNSR